MKIGPMSRVVQSMRPVTLAILACCGCFADAESFSSADERGSSGSSSIEDGSATSTTGSTSTAAEGDGDGDGATTSGEWSTGTDAGDGSEGGPSPDVGVGTESTGGSESSEGVAAESSSTGEPLSNCCVEHAGPGCDDAVIQQAVCSLFGECCLYGWTAVCVMQAENAALC